MHSFRLVPASEGPRREFKITLGLRAGYGSAGRIYRLEEAIRTAHRWMRELAARGAPFLSGMVTRGDVLYADSGGDAPSHREPVAIFTGEVLPQYAGDLDDGTVRELLGELATQMGQCLEQVQIALDNKARNLAAVRTCSFINCIVSRDGAAAKAAMLRKLAFLFRSRGHADNIGSSNLEIDHQAIIAAHARHDFDAAVRLLPIEAANVFAVVGSPTQCRARLEEYLAVGLDEAIIEVSGDREERELALDLVRDIAAQ